MPARSKRPSPPARMVELLMIEKRRILAERGYVTSEDFEQAWGPAWQTMVAEHAWPHATEHRRHWRQVMFATRPEMRAAFLDRPTSYSRLSSAFAVAAKRLRVQLAPEDLPMVILGAIRAGYSVAEDFDQAEKEVAA